MPPLPPLPDLGTVPPLAAADFAGRVGNDLGPSPWLTVDQQMIDAFAALTGDRAPIHTDPAFAAAAGFGGTIAHGFLTAALLSPLSYAAVPRPAEARHGVNYGFDRLRFVAPVPSGGRIRGRFTLAAADWIGTAELRLAVDAVVEIDGSDRPALVARWLTRWYF